MRRFATQRSDTATFVRAALRRQIHLSLKGYGFCMIQLMLHTASNAAAKTGSSGCVAVAAESDAGEEKKEGARGKSVVARVGGIQFQVFRIPTLPAGDESGDIPVSTPAQALTTPFVAKSAYLTAKQVTLEATLPMGAPQDADDTPEVNVGLRTRSLLSRFLLLFLSAQSFVVLDFLSWSIEPSFKSFLYVLLLCVCVCIRMRFLAFARRARRNPSAWHTL